MSKAKANLWIVFWISVTCTFRHNFFTSFNWLYLFYGLGIILWPRILLLYYIGL